MIQSTIICTLLVVLIAVRYRYQQLKEKWLKAGYKEGQDDLAASIIDKATWFSGCNYTAFNVLYLFALRQKKYGHVSPNKYREAILNMDHTKRIVDLTNEEIKNLVES